MREAPLMVGDNGLYLKIGCWGCGPWGLGLEKLKERIDKNLTKMQNICGREEEHIGRGRRYLHSRILRGAK